MGVANKLEFIRCAIEMSFPKMPSSSVLETIVKLPIISPTLSQFKYS